MVKSVIDYLKASCRAHGNKIAFKDSGGNKISFNQLYSSCKKIGSFIIDKIQIKEKPIVVITERNINSIASFLGVLFSGNFYVPVDATLPQERMAEMLKIIDPVLIINCADKEYESFQYDFINVADISPVNIYKHPRINSNSPMYGIFTSGSTGLPKLVVKDHRSIVSFIDEYVEKFNYSENDIQGNQIPFYFDASTKDLFTTLKVGCTTNIIGKSYFAQPGKLAEYIIKNRINSICWVPSALTILSMFNVFSKIDLTQIKKVLFVGEPMNIKQLSIWFKALPNTRFINLYGSTENAGNCLYYEVKEQALKMDRLPVGRAFDGAKVFLLDENNNIISESNTSVKGEICVSGDFLALGYYKNSKTTEQKFCQNPTNLDYYERILRTGDIGEYDKSGNIIYVCRKDYQIKLNGYRIELGDIESATMQLDSIISCCCLYNEKRKQVFLVYSANKEINTQIIDYLKQKLPSYMVPAKAFYLQSMPLNKNGKIDRAQLQNLFLN